MRNEDGFSLIELLVVLGLLSIVGASILGVATTTLRAERTAEDLARNLDDTRIAVERVRDEVRGADGICEDSDGQSMTVWTDRNVDGTVDSGEVVTFELVEDDGETVLQRQDDEGTRRLTGRLVDAEAFTYLGPGRSLATPNLDCEAGDAPGTSAVGIVDLFFEVDGRGVDSSGPLSVETTIVLRNAGLSASAPAVDDPPLDITRFLADWQEADGSYSVRAEIDGADVTHPFNPEPELEVRCGGGDWAPIDGFGFEEGNAYEGEWKPADTTGCEDATNATLRVSASLAGGATADQSLTLDMSEQDIAVSIDSPDDGSTLSGDVNITVSLSGAAASLDDVDRVIVQASDSSGDGPTWTLEDVEGEAATWETTSDDNGSYELTAVAESASGQALATSSSVSVDVENADTTPKVFVASIDDEVERPKKNRWEARVIFRLETSDGSIPDAPIVIEYDYNTNSDGQGSCTVDEGADGLVCVVEFDKMNPNAVESLSIDVTDVAANGYDYDDGQGQTSFSVDAPD